MSTTTTTSPEITIDPEFRDLIPPLSKEELEQLHSSLSARGVRDKLVVWKETGILVDGHNRYAFCQGKDIIPGPEYELVSFSDRERVKQFIIRNQLGRRNVDPVTAAHLRGLLYNSKKATQGGDRKSKDQSDTLNNAAESVAKETGVSAPTVKRDAKFASALEKLGMTLEEFKASWSNTPKQKIDYGGPCSGMEFWGMARSQLQRINKIDKERVQALEACIKYCQQRINDEK